MSLWTTLRDTAESAAVLVGNYYIPGSSLLTSKLTSHGSQDQLNSDIGQIAQIGSSIYGFTSGPLMNPSTPATPTTPGAATPAEPLTPAAATADPTAAASQATNVAAAPAAAGSAPAGNVGTWDKVSTWLGKNPVPAMMGANLAISGLSGIETAKTAKEKLDYERQQRDREIANLNAKTSVPLRAKPYQPLGLINGRTA